MTDMTINEERFSRKKLLVPLVVLLLCGVAFTGAAYAYTSTLNVNSNTVDSGVLSIDLTGGAATDSTVKLEGTNIVTFTDNFDYTKTNDVWAKTNQVGYEVAGGTVVTYDVTIDRETNNTEKVSLKIDVSGLSAVTIPVYSENAVSTVALTSLFKVMYTLDSGTATELTVTDGVASATATEVTVGHHDVIISLVLKDNVTTSGYTMARATAADNNNADSYRTAFASNTFSVAMQAISTAQ